MKILCSLFLAPALFLAAPSAHAQEMSFQKLEGKFDAAVLDLRSSVIVDRAPASAIGAVRSALVQRNRAAAELFPRAGSARARLQDLFDTLAARAARWDLYFEDIEAFVTEVAAARMDEEIAALDELVASGEMTSRLRYQHAVSLIKRITARVDELVQAPNLRPRLAAIMADLIAAEQRGDLGPAHVQKLRRFMVSARGEMTGLRSAVVTPVSPVIHGERLYRRGGYHSISLAPHR